ncbi:HNH endonuclease [Streptomyces sp. MJP52]|uniref:HNH endonuclease n=1 Tax=Streptomyces sp. MJP52 TaxID=2940555 RepID=UPI00247319F8|nr:HNH endonuclease [Streptomyces sp. MJP52]MDH6226221.1 5-methylcytosine-specific restriction endonuclease McrA [Streptomyces sp. MJP52]
MAGNPRNGRRYRRLTAEVRRRGDPCWLCGHDIDLTLDPRDPWSFTLDHVKPISRGGSLLDPANARSAHRRCNSSKGNRTAPASVGPASRRW